MVTLPKPFIATKYAGYFFNSDDRKLYTMKVTGVLRPLRYQYANRYNHLMYGNGPSKGGYQVSVEGRKRWLLTEYLETLIEHDAEIPVKETT